MEDHNKTQISPEEILVQHEHVDLPGNKRFEQLRSLMMEYVQCLVTGPGDDITRKMRHDIILGVIGSLQIYGGVVSGEHLHRSETPVHGGLAISPYAALKCAEDYERTDKFLCGLIDAICHKLAEDPRKKVNILEAGVGPLGVLVFPVASVFSPKEVEFSAVDIHPDSLATFRRIAEKLGMGAYLGKILCGDASRLDFSRELHTLPDIIVSEVMDAGLQEEPQIAVTRNLQQFLKPDGIFLPQKISLRGKVQLDGETLAEHDYFHLTTKVAQDIHNVLGSEYDDHTGSLRLQRTFRFPQPVDIPRHHQGAFVLSTAVQVFEDIKIHSQKSFITGAVTFPFSFPRHSRATSITVSTFHGLPHSKKKFSYRVG